MKITSLGIAIAFITALFFTSCENEEDVAKPEITLSELGYENSKIGYAGTDLHIEAEIIAEGKIDVVTIEIHPEGEHEKRFAVDMHEGEWEFDTTYTEFSGLKNTTFHKHIDIPVEAEPTDYHFHFVVTDMEGRQTLVEEELEIQQPGDNAFGGNWTFSNHYPIVINL